ncbi:DUF6705 family protein, partial [Flavobacterium sp. U410]
MKTIIYILSIFFTTICLSQNPIIDLLDDDGSALSGAYYKDVNNLLDVFEGTFIYTNGNSQLTIQLVKKVQQYNGSYYEDLLIGEYRYIKNGLEIINTLSEINQNYSYQYKHKIAGNVIADNDYIRWVCSTCSPNEKRIMVTISDSLSNRYGYLILRRMTVLNAFGEVVEGLQAKITNVSRSFS